MDQVPWGYLVIQSLSGGRSDSSGLELPEASSLTGLVLDVAVRWDFSGVGFLKMVASASWDFVGGHSGFQKRLSQFTR